MTASRMVISGARQVELMVPDEGGELRLHVPRTVGGPDRPPRNLIILASAEGGIVMVSDLLHYGAASLVELPHETQIHVRSLAPGIWNVVTPPSLHQALMLLAQPPATLPASAVFELTAARGTVDVSVPR